MRWSRPAFPWAPLIALPATLAILLIWQCSCGTPAAIPLMAVGVPSVLIPDPATTSTTHRLAALAMTGARILAGGSWLALLLMDGRRYLATLIWTGRFRTGPLSRIFM